MNDDEITVNVGGQITLPTGANVGDEFNVTGRVRVTKISEDTINVHAAPGIAPQTLPGLRRYTLLIQHLEPA